MSTFTLNARERATFDFGHLGKYVFGKVTQARSEKLEAISKELEDLQAETKALEGSDDSDLKETAEAVFDQRYIELLCLQIETMLLTRDTNTGKLIPASESQLAQKLVSAYRDDTVSEENALGLDDITRILNAVMREVSGQREEGND